MATWIDFKELRKKLTMTDVLAKYRVQLKVKGDRATGFCPLPGHPKKADGKRHSPSFSVNLRKGIFQCFSGGCGGKGNCLDFCCLMEGLNPDDPTQLRQGALKVQDIFGLCKLAPGSAKAGAAVMKNASVSAQANAQEPSGPAIVNAPLDFELKQLDPSHPYLASRGFAPETIAHFGLGYCAKGMMAERIAIPLHDRKGILIGYAGRLVDDDNVSDENPKYRFPGTRERKGTSYEFHKSELLYNGNRIEEPVNDLVVVEGFASVWWLWQHGYRNVVALMGSSVSRKQAGLLSDLLLPKGRLWIITDGDEAGVRCAKELFLAIAPSHLVRWIKLDEGQPTDLRPEELSAALSISK